jgi:hypothetical protein
MTKFDFVTVYRMRRCARGLDEKSDRKRKDRRWVTVKSLADLRAEQTAALAELLQACTAGNHARVGRSSSAGGFNFCALHVPADWAVLSDLSFDDRARTRLPAAFGQINRQPASQFFNALE